MESDRGTKRSFGERDAGGGPHGGPGGAHGGPGGPHGGPGGAHGGPFQGGGAPGFNMDGDMGNAIRCQIFGQDVRIGETLLAVFVEKSSIVTCSRKENVAPTGAGAQPMPLGQLQVMKPPWLFCKFPSNLVLSLSPVGRVK